MLEPPALAGDTLVGALETGFGIRLVGLVFLPVGNDPASWAYRVEVAGGRSLFLKVRAGAGAMPGAAVPWYLHRHGVPLVPAPVPTGAGTPWLAVDGFAVALYPLLDAATGTEVGLSRADWRELGTAVARAHALPPTPELAGLSGRETFRPSRRELLPRLEAEVAAADPTDPVAGALAGFWKARQEVIGALVDRADRLSRRLALEPSRQVLCHGDLHTWNVLVDADRRLWIVDWDEAVLAPRERDLMFVVGGIGHGLVQPGDTDSFLEGYGETSIDPRRLAYYRAAWAVQDIAAYGEQVLLAPDLGEVTRRAALEGFMDLFAPGNIVELAGRVAGRSGPG